MVYLDYDSISEALSDFGYFLPEEDELINKINCLATEFNLDVDDFVDDLLASAVNMKKKIVDSAILEHMEAELNKKLKKNLDGVIAPSSSKTKRPAFSERSVNQNHLNVSCFELEESVHEDFGSSELSGKYRAFAPVLPSPSNAKYQARSERGIIFQHLQGQLFAKSSAAGCSVTVEMFIFIFLEAKYVKMANFAAACREANPEISDWSIPVAGSTDSEYVYGEIIRDISEELPLSDQTVSLMMDDEAGTVMKLDLSHLPEVSVFPGQLVAYLGSFENGDRFVATRQFFPKSLPLSPLGRPPTDENLRVWCASGPFTTAENCSYEPLCDLLEMVKLEQPHVLILMGPFVDAKNNFMRRPQFPETYEEVMNQLMRNIAKFLDGCRTELMVQPAPFRDVCCDPVFPTPPLKICSDASKRMGKRLHSLPEPCVVRINGVEIALTSSEVIAHLSKNEWHRSEDQENRDRIARLASHTINQRSLYPLSPPSLPTSMEECLRVCALRTAPHVIIGSSVLSGSVKNIGGTVAANPGILARGSSGTFLRCEFASSIAQDAVNLCDCSRFEVVKL
ncbi:DNA polymerase epsilon subunit B [Necator americanus]|uniref:DNA polymerase alpha subunit B n=1 Tax=Necator americanus TaxID=51031 RepID=W2TNB0_NECAM|nr:DNA polymerase epsilon subunit B [Necator americanus]ETN83590.1 DNA polymerase epsilon subunit B [Necator americanus]